MLSVASPALLFKTTEAGMQLVYQEEHEKAFYDSNGCLWIPRLFCDFSEDNPATLTSTTTHGKLTRDDVGASKQYSNDQFLKIQKSWIWKKPATAKNNKSTSNDTKSRSAEFGRKQ